MLLAAGDLLPDAWRFMRGTPVSVFNPGLVRDGDSWLLAARVVGPDGLRRISMCRLDERLHLIPQTATPFSDGIAMDERVDPSRPRRWFADPRLYRLGGGLWMYFNTGWQEPRNFQFLQEVDPHALMPVGPPRELVLRAGIQPIEKNWTFLEDAPGFAVYAPSPHRVLRYSLDGGGPIEFTDAVTSHWDADDWASRYGPLRGGAPPVRVGSRYFAFGHSLRQEEDGVRYVAMAYTFDARPPFAPLQGPRVPLPLGNPFGPHRIHGKLNPAVSEVVYPCGAAFTGDAFVVSHGINDEQCAVTVLPIDDVEATLR